MNSTSQEPTLEQFDEVLELLARELHDDDDLPREEWIRSSLCAAGLKLRVLDFMLKRRAPGSVLSLLDIGAQVGSLAIYATRLGIRASAVDLPSFTEKFAKASLNHGVDYRPCDLTTNALPFPDQSFDYVAYLDVIEHHHHSPKRVLGEIHRVLKPNGRIFLSTPNQASIYNRVALLFGNSISDPFDYFFQSTAHLTPYPGHHREYVRDELRSALTNSGFRTIECRVIDEDFRPMLWLAMRERHGTVLHKLWRRKKYLGAAMLGTVWSAVGLPFGRFIWAVGEKPPT
jgi:2-polyprenyl-3-methyl-5-hydroxy-6-metoxy-1,4-benzoquinol methylase